MVSYAYHANLRVWLKIHTHSPFGMMGKALYASKEIALMRRLDKRDAINFVDASEDDASLPLDREIILARFHVTENAENSVWCTRHSDYVARHSIATPFRKSSTERSFRGHP